MLIVMVVHTLQHEMQYIVRWSLEMDGEKHI